MIFLLLCVLKFEPYTHFVVAICFLIIYGCQNCRKDFVLKNYTKKNYFLNFQIKCNTRCATPGIVIVLTACSGKASEILK